MSVGALVTHVGRVLGHGHALFGDPPESGGVAAAGAGSALAGAAETVRSGKAAVSGMSGRFATNYGSFAEDSSAGLDGVAGTDSALPAPLDQAADTDRSGRADSGAVIDGARTDTAAIGPVSNTPAGEKALIMALRSRVAQQKAIIAAARAHDARLAAQVRTMAYHGPGMGGGSSPMSAASPGGMGSFMPSMPSIPSMSSMPSMAGLTHHSRRRHGRVRGASRDFRADSVPGGPAEKAVQAALSRRGCAYVWGATGPDQFDCSGLTGWAWRQAGVQLGRDTYAQVTQGVPVAEGQVRAGDLIFPKNAWDSRGPGHVQMAISPTEVVEAQTSGVPVKISPMPSAYVARRPVPA